MTTNFFGRKYQTLFNHVIFKKSSDSYLFMAWKNTREKMSNLLPEQPWHLSHEQISH